MLRPVHAAKGAMSVHAMPQATEQKGLPVKEGKQ